MAAPSVEAKHNSEKNSLEKNLLARIKHNLQQYKLYIFKEILLYLSIFENNLWIFTFLFYFKCIICIKNFFSFL